MIGSVRKFSKLVQNKHEVSTIILFYYILFYFLKIKVSLIPGDGIGPEISNSVKYIFKAVNVRFIVFIRSVLQCL